MFCNGNCGICRSPCYRGELKAVTPEEEQGASEAFDSAEVSSDVVLLQKEEFQTEEKGLAVVENIGTYEVKKTVFGKDKVRRVK